MEIENLIESKFRDIKLETKVLSFLLRKDCTYISFILKNYFTISPFQDIFDIILFHKVQFQKDILYKFVKKNVKLENYDIHKTYIIKLYKDDISGIDKKNIKTLIEKLKEYYNSRTFMLAINDIVSNADSFNYNKTKQKIQRIFYSDSLKNERVRGEYLEDFEERKKLIEYRQKNPEALLGVPTGINRFDELSGGLMKGEFGIVIASTGVGKSLTLGNFAINAWLKNYNVMFVSLEMTKHQIEYRFDSRITRIFHNKFRKAELDESDYETWNKKIQILKERRKNFLEIMYMSRGCSVNDVEDEMIKIQSERGAKIDLLIIDYLNLMSSDIKHGDKRDWKHQAEVAWDIKNLSMEFNSGEGIPIWTANQLTDEGSSADKIQTKHLKYSRAISEVAPVIVALNLSIDDKLEDIIKMWIIKCRDFEKIKRPIILHPRFNILMLNSEISEMKVRTQK